MSIEASRLVMGCSRMKGSGRVVMGVLADHADAELKCWPSVATIARRSNLSERSVRRWLRRCEEMGEITTHLGGGRRQGSAADRGYQGAPNVYRITLRYPDNPDSVMDGKPGQSRQGNALPIPGHSGPFTRTSPVANPDSPGRLPGQGCPPNPKESSREPSGNLSGSGANGFHSGSMRGHAFTRQNTRMRLLRILRVPPDWKQLGNRERQQQAKADHTVLRTITERIIDSPVPDQAEARADELVRLANAPDIQAADRPMAAFVRRCKEKWANELRNAFSGAAKRESRWDQRSPASGLKSIEPAGIGG